MSRNTLAVILLHATLLAACATSTGRYAPESVLPAEQSIRNEDLMEHVKVLASDRFGGRGPGTTGERLTVDYLVSQFRKAGLAPGNPDGSYVQRVPLVGMTATRAASLTAGGKRMRMKFPEDYVAVSRRVQPKVAVTGSDVVFVGYGVVAPEYGWDDFKGVDVKGKTVVMLIGDPPIPQGKDAATLDPDMFNGRAMTYYGRWTYKYEIASARGAAAALIVHETGPAGYPYQVVVGSWGRENFVIDRADGHRDRVAVEGWITQERAATLFALSGQNFDALKQSALSKDFRPVALPAQVSFTLNNTIRRVKSQNVIAKLEGSDPELKDQVVVHSAHWDHLGTDPALKGDQIYNGALDNATGTAGLLELAQAYTKLPAPPRRSVLFLAVTAEEKGLLGSAWYAENPLYPVRKTVANINMDGLNPWGRTRDLVVVGKGQSTLEDVLEDVMKRQGRRLVPDQSPERGSYYRSDHFEFAKVGVPALYTGRGVDYEGQDAAWGKAKIDAYVTNDYHKVSDEPKPDWKFDGAVQDLQALLRVGLTVAEDNDLPEWKSGSEFRARREAMLKD